MKYYVEYNAKFIGIYKTLRGALGFIKRKGLFDDEDNLLCLMDSNGELYDPMTGEKLTH